MLYIIALIVVLGLGGLYVLTVFWGSSFRRLHRSKNAPVATLQAEVNKIYYNPYGSPPAVSFRVDGEKRPRKFDSRIPEITQFPEPGTRGTLTCKGSILYSFRWNGGEVVQDTPGPDGAQTYSNL